MLLRLVLSEAEALLHLHPKGLVLLFLHLLLVAAPLLRSQLEGRRDSQGKLLLFNISFLHNFRDWARLSLIEQLLVESLLLLSSLEQHLLLSLDLFNLQLKVCLDFLLYEQVRLLKTNVGYSRPGKREGKVLKHNFILRIKTGSVGVLGFCTGSFGPKNHPLLEWEGW